MIDEQNAIYDSVSGLVFMGTPHAGSRVDELNRIKMLKLLGKAISISYPDKLVKTLSAQSDGLVDLSEDFEKTTIFIKHEIEICTYYETKTTCFLGSEEVSTLCFMAYHLLESLTLGPRLYPLLRHGCIMKMSEKRA